MVVDDITATYAEDANHSGSAGSATVTLLVPNTPGVTLLSGGRLLLIGTSGDDDLKVNPGGGAAVITVDLNGSRQTFRGVTDAGAGGDDVQVVGGVTPPAVVFGEVGIDNLRRGGGARSWSATGTTPCSAGTAGTS